jgi:hypothetical protein
VGPSTYAPILIDPPIFICTWVGEELIKEIKKSITEWHNRAIPL